MPAIVPFRGILYNPGSVRIEDVVAPPYDVIAPDEQALYYERSPYNVVRLILNRDADPYSSAARFFTSWREDNILLKSPTPAIYVVAQEFSIPDGGRFVRRGFLAGCRLEKLGEGSIMPHEKTHAGPKEDRLRLFKATGVMMSQIFSVYDDTSSTLEPLLDEITSKATDYEADLDGVRARLWPVTGGSFLNAASRTIGDRPVTIADGHHRYETLLAYRDFR